MVWGNLLGQMGSVTRDNIRMTKSTGMENTFGPKGVSTKVFGRMD